MREDRVAALLQSLDRAAQPDELTVARMVRSTRRQPARAYRLFTASMGVLTVAAAALVITLHTPAPLVDNDAVAMLDLPESALHPWDLTADTCDVVHRRADECLPDEDLPLAAMDR